MIIKGSCEHCQGHLEFDAENAGEVVPCPHCGQSTVLSSAPTVPPPPPMPPPNAEQKLRACPDCGKQISQRTPACPHCGAPVQRTAPDSRKTALATVCLVFGILSITVFPLLALMVASFFGAPIFALPTLALGVGVIIAGHFAHSRTRRLPDQYAGKGRAIAGFILGYLSLPIGLGILFLCQMWKLQAESSRRSMYNSMCESHMKQIGLAFRQWSIDHDDQYPFNVSVAKGGSQQFCERDTEGYDRNSFKHFRVMAEELNSPRVLVCPLDSTNREVAEFSRLTASNITYQIRTGAAISAEHPDEIMMRCPIHKFVVLADGSVQRYAPSRSNARSPK